MNEFTLQQIGTVTADGERATITLEPDYRDGLKELNGFSHVNVLFWCHHLDIPEYRSYVLFPKVYRTGPDAIGVFATRSPVRPNPIAVTTCAIVEVDEAAGTMTVTGIDAEDDSPVIDIKPYLPCEDRVRDASVPEWCSHWPTTVEDSATFDWSNELIPQGE